MRDAPTRVRQRPDVEEVREYRGKRCLDVILAVVALVVSVPIWIAVALAIKLEDGRRVFFAQRRWGRGGKVIRVHKFRTMVVDAEERFGPVQARQNDPRVTRVGRLLRATSLDELPQVLSILRGDMSWVGPRALPINEVQVRETSAHAADSEIPGFRARCAVRPGLTGIAQIYAPRDVARRRKFRYDIFYIRNQSLTLDLRLILVSVWITVRGAWGRPEGMRRAFRGQE